VDIVYLVKEAHNNPELQYSLRSLQNIPHDNVHFVGFTPRWVRGINSIPYRAIPPGPEKHQKWWISWKMLRHACIDPDISDEFILFNDDFFVMQPIDEVPMLHRGQISGVVDPYRKRVKFNKYVAAMIETQEMLRMMEKTTLCYEMHTPMVIDKHKMTTAMEIAEAVMRPGLAHINKRSFYANYWEVGGTSAADIKVDSARPNFDQNSVFLSTTEQSFATKPVGAFIRKTFPDSSVYELSRRSRGSAYKSRTARGVSR
jgi:hypothetical protein